MSNQIQKELEKLMIMVQQGKGEEYLKKNKSYFDKTFPIQEKPVLEAKQKSKSRFLEDYMVEKRV